MANQKTKDKRIRTIKELKHLVKNGLDCFILLNGGIRSSKHIRYCSKNKHFSVFNLIDDSEQELTQSQIFDSAYSNIGEAMKKGALIMN
jgi:tRNA-dihydrouridine synthase